MNALIRKEMRLLLPSWLAAIFLLVTPAVLGRAETPVVATLLLAGVAVPFVTALGTFGREFNSGTFSSLIALPVSRSRCQPYPTGR